LDKVTWRKRATVLNRSGYACHDESMARYHFADRKALDVARRLGLGGSARHLAKLVKRQDRPRLLSGLVRVGLAREVDEMLKKAA
jgi:hypothetical protein